MVELMGNVYVGRIYETNFGVFCVKSIRLCDNKHRLQVASKNGECGKVDVNELLFTILGMLPKNVYVIDKMDNYIICLIRHSGEITLNENNKRAYFQESNGIICNNFVYSTMTHIMDGAEVIAVFDAHFNLIGNFPYSWDVYEHIVLEDLN